MNTIDHNNNNYRLQIRIFFTCGHTAVNDLVNRQPRSNITSSPRCLAKEWVKL